MGVDGSNPRQVTNNTLAEIAPAWSPDGRWIAFSSDGEGFNAVYKTRANGSGRLRRLTPPEMQAGAAAWSPDGEKIAFSDNLCGTCDESDIWVMELRTGALRQLTDTPENELFPNWSADGRRITYESSQFLNGHLFPPDVLVVDAEGGTPENVTNSPDVVDATPKFVPRQHCKGVDEHELDS